MQALRGKSAVVTGGSRGIGLHIGRALASEGVNVALVALPDEAEQLEAAAQEMRAQGVSALGIGADITNERDRESLLQRARAELGAPDILINNAGVEPLGRFVRQSPEEIVRAIETNLSAPLLLARLVLPGMLARGFGRIVTISSMVAKKGTPYTAAYSASKAGLNLWTEGMRGELEGTPVNVSVVCPGYVSEAGILAEYGHRAPRLLAVSAEKVARAVVRALQHDSHEVLVVPGPIRPLLALDVFAPGLASSLLKWIGVVEFHRTLSDARESSARALADEARCIQGEVTVP